MVKEQGMKVEVFLTILKYNTLRCQVCLETNTKDEMVTMIHCNDTVCRECFVKLYTLVIREKSVKHFNCLVCGEPNIVEKSNKIDLYLRELGYSVQLHICKELFDLYSQKTNEYVMMKDPNFMWCNGCFSALICDLSKPVTECPNPDCREQVCSVCKKQWDLKHKCSGHNDFRVCEVPNTSIARYLEQVGIPCPECRFYYNVVFDGCMHMTCTQCPTEFCVGCSELFKKDCTKYESCRSKGLHAHHPRNCQYYLRDESIDDLQKLLIDNKAHFETEEKFWDPNYMELKTSHMSVQECCVLLVDGEICGDSVRQGQAGLCENHFRDYLVYKVNENQINPLPLYNNICQHRAILMRSRINIPLELNQETTDHYKGRLLNLIKENLPLKYIKGPMFNLRMHRRNIVNTAENITQHSEKLVHHHTMQLHHDKQRCEKTHTHHLEKKSIEASSVSANESASVSEPKSNYKFENKLIEELISSGEAICCPYKKCEVVWGREFGESITNCCCCGTNLTLPNSKKIKRGKNFIYELFSHNCSELK